MNRGKAERPYGGYFDDVVTDLTHAVGSAEFARAVESVSTDHAQLTLRVARRHLIAVATAMRDDPALRFEFCAGVTGVHYPQLPGQELCALYQLMSIHHNRRVCIEVTAPESDPHIPSLCTVYPTCDWHEREAYDFFGIVFDGHPALTRIEMPDDWVGHPQRKDYPLGGIAVEYHGARIAPPDQRGACCP